ncbi:MAG TPA: dicarboxylate/amino acid:cation symporter [Longimicrobiales bacterium]|nr:dicarboxylate/amino acid:cation symporter [Longimicrobiales bacterium]
MHGTQHGSPEDGRTRGRGPRIPLHTKILLGLALGAVAGIATNLLAADARWVELVITYVAQPVGQVFLGMLFMVVIPLVFTTLAVGVAGLGDLSSLGRVGGKTIAFFLATTFCAVVLGLTLANLVAPGESIDPAVRSALLAEYSMQAADRVTASENTSFGIQTFVNIVPRNPLSAAVSGDMLGVIFFTLMFGIALTRIPPDLSGPVIRWLEGVAQAIIEIIGFAMRLAPYGVAGLIFSVTAQFGLDVLRSLALYVAMVLFGLLIHQFGTLALVGHVFAGIHPRTLYSRARFMMITAFSTSSSNATMPTTLRTAEEEFGVPREIAGFVIPLGATMNMNGTALFEGMTVLFLAQVFGIDLSIGAQLIVVIMSIITAIGAAGVPGGSIPLLVMVLIMVGIPGEGIALILGVDRILDMARTVPNVTGDLLASAVVARSEGYDLVPATAPDFSTEAAIEAMGGVVLDGQEVERQLG